MKELKIRIIENGYEVITEEEVEDDKGFSNDIEKITAFAYDDDCPNYVLSNCKAIQGLLYNIMHEVGFDNSKHNPYRINVEIEEQKQG